MELDTKVPLLIPTATALPLWETKDRAVPFLLPATFGIDTAKLWDKAEANDLLHSLCLESPIDINLLLRKIQLLKAAIRKAVLVVDVVPLTACLVALPLAMKQHLQPEQGPPARTKDPLEEEHLYPCGFPLQNNKQLVSSYMVILGILLTQAAEKLLLKGYFLQLQIVIPLKPEKFTPPRLVVASPQTLLLVIRTPIYPLEPNIDLEVHWSSLV